jgi:hypothetical protein
MTDYLAVMLPASLPRENYDLLKSLFLHFHKVVQHKDVNKMVRSHALLQTLQCLKPRAGCMVANPTQTEANMATVWGPNMMINDDPMSMQAGNLPETIKTLIKNAPTIFTVLFTTMRVCARVRWS